MAEKVMSTNDFRGAGSPDLLRPNITATLLDMPIQSVTRRIYPSMPIGLQGVRVPIVQTKPEAYFVNEMGLKPITSTEYSKMDIIPRKIAATVVTSDELKKTNPVFWFERLKSDFQDAFNEKIDHWMMETVASATATAGVDPVVFDPTDPEKSVTDIENYFRGNAIRGLNFFAYDGTTLPAFGAVKDTTGRPLYRPYGATNSAINFQEQADNDFYTRLGLGAYNTLFHDGLKVTPVGGDTVLGVAGNNRKAVYCDVSSLTWKESDSYEIDVEDPTTHEITHETRSAKQRNEQVFIFEAEVAFGVLDPTAFVPIIADDTNKKIARKGDK